MLRLVLRRSWQALRLLLFFLLLVLVAVPEWPAFQDEAYRLRTHVGQREFDFLIWELDALQVKGQAALVGGHRYLDEASRHALVAEFVDLTGRARALNAQIQRSYAGAAGVDPGAAAAALQTELDAVRVEIGVLQPVAEAILEEQVAAVLVAEGFGIGGAAWPPVKAHVTQPPLVLVVSPRDRIEQAFAIPLLASLPIPDQDSLEAGILADEGLSALVVPIGGLGIYPAMVVESGDLNWLVATFAHEWAHHWLTLHPLGLRYGAAPELRVINETVASILGDEIGALVMARYYPDRLPPPAPQADASAPAPAPAPPVFDFREEMRLTRVAVDRLLAEGQVTEAEAYMAVRQQLFAENGYGGYVRKLNQAYFAFYGAYADTPGANGGDPIGPAVVALRERSPSLADFMRAVAPLTSFAELQALLANPAP